MPRTISVAMIVRDESAHLAECLETLQGFADEIRIVDTGSRDNTMEIARQFGAKVSFFIWCDDFSAARNESLRQCSSDWIFVLDADERVARADQQRVKELLEAGPKCCHRFTTRNYTNTGSVGEFQPCEAGDPNARGFAGWYPSAEVRLFPNHAGAKFEGRVRERVHASLEAQGIRVLTGDAPIHRYPYLEPPQRILEELERRIQPDQEKILENPGDPQAHAKLGNRHSEMGDHARAAAVYRESLRRDPSNPIVLKDLGGTLHLLKHDEPAKRALELALRLDPGLADAWRHLGVIYADEKDWALAVECFERGLEADPSWADGHRYLGIALEGAGRLPRAVQESRKALEANPDAAEALSLYIHQMLRLDQRTQAREVLEEILPRARRAAALHNTIGELCYYDHLHDEALDHFQAAARDGSAAAYNNLGVVHYQQKRFGEALQAFEQCLAIDPAHRGARANLDKLDARTGNDGDQEEVDSG